MDCTDSENLLKIFRIAFILVAVARTINNLSHWVLIIVLFQERAIVSKITLAELNNKCLIFSKFFVTYTVNSKACVLTH